MPGLKCSIRFEIDQLGVEVRATLAPEAGGPDSSPDSVLTLLAERGVKEGISREEIEKAFRTLQRKGEPVTFVAARGTPPRAPEPETCALEPLSLPESIKAAAEAALAAAKPPEVFRVRLERMKVEKQQQKKSGFGIFSRKQEPQAVWETKTVREAVTVDPAVTQKGYVPKGAVVARVKPAVPGKDGRSVFGKPVLVPRTGRGGILLGANVVRRDAEIVAAVSGILRKGADWFDVVPYQGNDASLSVEGSQCYLSFTPGTAGAAPPNMAALMKEAAALGFPREALIPETEIAKILREAAAAGKSVSRRPITIREDAVITVTVSQDRMRAVMTLKKGLGAGRTLALADVGDAIRKSGVRAYDAERVKSDVLAFHNSRELSLSNYELAVGQPPEDGEDGRIEYVAQFLRKEEADEIIRRSAENREGMSAIKSLSELPLSAVESVCRIKAGAEILRITAPKEGRPGMDVMKVVVPAKRGAEPAVRLLENVLKKKDDVVSGIDGIAEVATVGGALLVRARLHRDGMLRVSLSEDRMKGLLTYIPAEGTGMVTSYEDVRGLVEKEGIVQGILSDVLLKALGAISKNTLVRDLCIAQGKPPKGSECRKPVFHVKVASGSHVAVLDDGRADFKNQDMITQVSRGTLLATLPAPGQGLEDGWDVTGKPIPAMDKGVEGLQAGKGVRIEEQPDGSAKYFADLDGELMHENGVLEVRELHTVAGDVDLGTGNVKFKGNVHVKGAVLSGFSLVSGGDAVIDEVVQAAFVSSEGSIWVGHGIKGEGRAVLRARGGIIASFAEQASLIALGDITLNHGCVRCQVKCNGRLILESEKGVLMGGTTKAKLGATVFNLGSAGGARTVVSFGQDYVVQDQIEREVKELEELKRRIAELDAGMKKLERSGQMARRALEEARVAKLKDLKELEQRNMRLIGLRDKVEEHFASQVVIRGTLFPGAVVESHGRLYSVKEERTHIALSFDPAMGRIIEKPAL